MRFSLRRLLLFTAFIAIVIAAIIYVDLWVGGTSGESSFNSGPGSQVGYKWFSRRGFEPAGILVLFDSNNPNSLQPDRARREGNTVVLGSSRFRIPRSGMKVLAPYPSDETPTVDANFRYDTFTFQGEERAQIFGYLESLSPDEVQQKLRGKLK